MELNGKVLVLGDVHGDWRRLKKFISDQAPDAIVQVGDFGYWHPFELALDVPLYFIDGNHEHHPTLPSKVTEVGRNVFYVPRGTVAKLNGKNCLFMGGAASIDFMYRTEGVDWFKEEIISESDLYNLPDLRIHTVFSHTAPSEFNMREGIKFYDPSRDRLSYILKKYEPRLWFSGHYHYYLSGFHKETYWQALSDISQGKFWVEYH